MTTTVGIGPGKKGLRPDHRAVDRRAGVPRGEVEAVAAKAHQVCPYRNNIDVNSKLRGCDVVAVRVDDVAPNGYALDRREGYGLTTRQYARLVGRWVASIGLDPHSLRRTKAT